MKTSRSGCAVALTMGAVACLLLLSPSARGDLAEADYYMHASVAGGDLRDSLGNPNGTYPDREAWLHHAAIIDLSYSQFTNGLTRTAILSASAHSMGNVPLISMDAQVENSTAFAETLIDYTFRVDKLTLDAPDIRVPILIKWRYSATWDDGQRWGVWVDLRDPSGHRERLLWESEEIYEPPEEPTRFHAEDEWTVRTDILPGDSTIVSMYSLIDLVGSGSLETFLDPEISIDPNFMVNGVPATDLYGVSFSPNLNTIPEPTTFGLCSLGFGLAFLMRHRRLRGHP